jgi:hypothetical protein
VGIRLPCDGQTAGRMSVSIGTDIQPPLLRAQLRSRRTWHDLVRQTRYRSRNGAADSARIGGRLLGDRYGMFIGQRHRAARLSGSRDLGVGERPYGWPYLRRPVHRATEEGRQRLFGQVRNELLGRLGCVHLHRQGLPRPRFLHYQEQRTRWAAAERRHVCDAEARVRCGPKPSCVIPVALPPGVNDSGGC